MGATNFNGPVRSANGETDGGLWLPAAGGAGGFTFIGGTWTPSRDGAGLYRMAKTAGAGTTYALIDLAQVIQKLGADPSANTNGKHVFRGIQLVSADVAYSIATAALTSLTPNFYRTLFANNSAPAVSANPGGAITGNLPVAIQANPYVQNLKPANPYVLGANAADNEDMLELAIVDPGTSLFSLYGVQIYFNYDLL